MPTLNFDRAQRALQRFDFPALFIEELGWNQPPSARATLLADVKGAPPCRVQAVAQLSGVVVLRVAPAATSGAPDQVPDAKAREAIHRALEQQYREHLLLFTDREGPEPSQVLVSWAKADGAKRYLRAHLYVRGQAGDLLLTRLAGIFFDLSDLDDRGNAELLNVTGRLRQALDVEAVTKKFYAAFQQQQYALIGQLHGLPDDATRRHYASVLLTRLMFVYFLQERQLLDGGNKKYLQGQLADHIRQQPEAPATWYRRFLQPLFFEGFAKPANQRSVEVNRLLRRIPYLNGGLFLPHPIEEKYADRLDVPDDAFGALFGVFEGYTWHLDDTPGGQDNEINPDVLGYILEKYINASTSKQKAAGAYYTPREITQYLCDRTVDQLLLNAVNESPDIEAVKGMAPPRRFERLPDLLTHLDDGLARKVLHALREMTLLDPACGSGAFLVAALKKLLDVYTAVVGYVKVKATDPTLKSWLAGLEDTRKHPSVAYFLKKEIITRSLYGVDLMTEAVEIARLRLFLALVASARAQHPEDLEPLPNIDFNLLCGNGLVGLLHVDDHQFRGGGLFAGPEFRARRAEKERLIDLYRGTADTLDRHDDSGALLLLRDRILEERRQAQQTLDAILTDELRAEGIKFEQARWDGKKETYTKRPLATADVVATTPFHWAYEFPRILDAQTGRGGFDAIIANPPWEAFKPNAKEFFQQYSETVEKNGMRIEDFEDAKADLLAAPAVRAAWEAYLSQFPFQSAYFSTSADYAAQTSLVGGRKAASDLNLYKLFLERAFRLLRPGGAAGIVVPTGLYTDLGTKGLRQLLFDETQVLALFGLSNERKLFADVHHAFKYAVVAFVKGGHTTSFPAAFRIQPREAVGAHDLEAFLTDPRQHVQVPVAVVRRLSPDSLSVPEFRSELDIRLLEKLGAHPALGEEVDDTWRIRFGAEFHMTADSDLFLTTPGPTRLPLFEGKMMHQFRADFAEPRYWVEAAAGRARVLGARTPDTGQRLGYQQFRLAYRAIARSSDQRTLIVAVLPENVFCGNSLGVDRDGMPADTVLYLLTILNSLVIDYRLRQSVSANINQFYLNQLPIPRLTAADPRFGPLMQRAARLVCTVPAFDGLARAAGLPGHQALIDTDRHRLRAEIDGLVAHLYGLTEAEFDHILATFPLVPEPAKVAARNAYRTAST